MSQEWFLKEKMMEEDEEVCESTFFSKECGIMTVTDLITNSKAGKLAKLD